MFTLQLTIATLHANKAALQDAKLKIENACGIRLGPPLYADPAIRQLTETLHRAIPQQLRAAGVDIMRGTIADTINPTQMVHLLRHLQPTDRVRESVMKYGFELCWPCDYHVIVSAPWISASNLLES